MGLSNASASPTKPFMSGIWTQHVSTLVGSEGKTYYFNSKVGSQWDYPAGATIARPIESSAPVNARAALPAQSEWQATVDQQSGRVYYYNTRTSATSWENPDEKPAAVDQGASYIEMMKKKLRDESQASFSKGGNPPSTTNKRKADWSTDQNEKRPNPTAYAQMVAGYGNAGELKDIVLGGGSTMEGYAASGYGKAYM
jgi:hypothetical protein